MRRVLALLALLALAGCTPTPVGEELPGPPPDGAVLPERGEPQVSVSRYQDDRLAVTTWGSSACPRVPVEVEAVRPGTVRVRVDRVDGNDGCTDDLAPTTHVVDLPAGADPRVVQVDGLGPRLEVVLPAG